MTGLLDRTDAGAEADRDVAAMSAPIAYASGASADDPDPAEGGGSKWNAVRHGLMAKSLFPADLAAEIKRYTAMLTDQFSPTTPYEVGLIGVMGRSGAQWERCQNLKVVDLQRTMDRAVLCWDSDRCVYIDDLAARLARDPGRVARALGWTKQGADWMHATWHGLGEVLATNGAWDDSAQRRLAFDLLGVRPELRDGSLKVPEGTDTPALVALVRAETARLEARQKTSLRALDRCDQDMAAAGMPMEEDAATKRLRKYEASARREYQAAKSELLRARAEAADAAANPPTPSEPTPAPTPSPSPSTARTDPPPTPRPTTSSTAFNFLLQRSKLKTLLIPKAETEETAETDTAPVGPAVAQASTDAEPVAEPAGLAPQTVDVASNNSRSAAGPDRRDRRDRRDRQRRLRRAQEQQSRGDTHHKGR